ncbi:MAG: tetraacyldisaccharide 4'-kinase [Candidatus Omnitrophota bacterium]|jgi:tetraacyldisaccharide 4'-kinase
MREYLYRLATDREKGVIPGFLKFFLLILSLVYGLIIGFLAFLCRLKLSYLDCRVISVGNITLGGTGKTALVEYIARCLKEKGLRVAILSRGYKRMKPSMGDEPYMLSKNLGDVPVIVGADRIRGAKQAIEIHRADNLILDDGFQQWRIKKDLEIVTISATQAFGNRRVIPRGVMREPLSSLKRADVFVLTKTDLNPDTQEIKDFLKRINPPALIVESVHSTAGFYKLGESEETLNADALKGKIAALFSGIGDPDSFESLIKRMGIGIGLSFRFPDHHNYSEKDLDNIIRESEKKNIDTVITTEKDAARLLASSPVHGRASVFVLRIELKITRNEEEFRRRLLGLRRA